MRGVFGGRSMVNQLMEGLVLDVVMGAINDESKDLTLDSDFAALDVDQLTMTYVVLELESRLGIELPTQLEDARTIAELVSGAQDALRASVAIKCRLPQNDDYPPMRFGRPLLGRQSAYRNLSQLSPWRPRR
jgi:acyl carrier protein